MMGLVLPSGFQLVSDIYSTSVIEKSILIVDDDILVCMILQSILEFYFSEVYIAHNGEDGIDLYKNKVIDIVITDITMPQMDGIEMAKYLKGYDSDLKLIFMTGHNEDTMLEKMYFWGNAVVIKPIMKDDVLENIAKVLCLPIIV